MKALTCRYNRSFSASMPPNYSAKHCLSVVIPTRDTRTLTEACVKSVLAVMGDGTEVIVVDDASRDETAEMIVRRFPGVRVLRSQRPCGFTRSANRGLGTARGQILLLLNSDTEMLPGAWEALEGAFGGNQALGVAGARLQYPDGTPQWSGGESPGLLWLFVLASGLAPLLARFPGARALRPPSAAAGGAADWVTGAAMAFRRQVWLKVGPLDESFRLYAQDLDFCTRARRVGWSVAVVSDFRVLHHHGATIGGRRGAVRRQKPQDLWSDLVRWGRKHRGEAWARRAAAALRAGATLRLVGRALRRWTLRREVREEWCDDSLIYRRALAAVREEAAALRGSRCHADGAPGLDADRLKRS